MKRVEQRRGALQGAGRRGFVRRAIGSVGAWALAHLALTRSASAQYQAAPAGNAPPGSGPEGAPKASEASAEVRLALLFGNRSYPEPFDLPPIPKNVRDMRGALEHRGFDVTDALDKDLVSSRQALATFIQKARSAPANATLFFYFTGHGLQIDSANLLLPADLSPAARSDALRKGSMQLLDDVVSKLPDRREGLTIAVVDACRTSLKALNDDEGLNQVEAPAGCLIAFSTAAGKPAIAPAVDSQNTFYTASLVRMMGSVSDETSFNDLFKLVKTDVREVMQRHPVEAIRRLAQDPFIADHSLTRVNLAPAVAGSGDRGRRFNDATEEADWSRLQQATWPPDVLQLAETYLRNHPNSKLASGAVVARDGAREASKILQRSDVRLYRAAFQLSPAMPVEQRLDLVRAGAGDKDAAAREGRRALSETSNPSAGSRYEGWMQYAAALGNGIAAYQLALYYRRLDQPLLAARFEARARELGYTPPPTLDNVRK